MRTPHDIIEMLPDDVHLRWGRSVGAVDLDCGLVTPTDTLAASLLLRTELHCAANRRPESIEHKAVADVLSAIDLVEPESGDLMTAPLLPGTLRPADAIHLATALRI
jgi:hypothetical protein